MPPEVNFDPARLDLNNVVADHDAILRINPQRFEMEQLTAIVLVDTAQHLIAGYKDVDADEFWVRGHMPGYPLMPGVLMCEAAAQLCSYYMTTLRACFRATSLASAAWRTCAFAAPSNPAIAWS